MGPTMSDSLLTAFEKATRDLITHTGITYDEACKIMAQLMADYYDTGVVCTAHMRFLPCSSSRKTPNGLGNVLCVESTHPDDIAAVQVYQRHS